MRNVLTVLTLASLVAAPSALAAWGAKGMLEPDTQRDIDDGWMWRNADNAPDGVRRVYFNGFQGQYWGYAAGVSTAFSPNLAALGTAHQTYPFMSWAMLGVWKDCNNDGYVGLGDQGLFEYRVELLLDPQTLRDPGICPVEEIPSKIPDNWAPIHNDGAWVHEWIPIGWDTWKTTVAADGEVTYRPNDYNPWNFNVTTARVWADWNLPEDETPRTCYVRPHPRGTYQNTGNFLDFADCHAGGKIRNAGGVIADLTGQHALWAQLQDVDNPWGTEKDEAYVDVFHCETGDRIVDPKDPTWDDETKSGVSRPGVPDPTHPGGTYYPSNRSWDDGYLAYGLNISSPHQPNFNPDGSMGGTINETDTDRDDCDRTDSRQGSNGNLPYALEGDVDNTDSARTEPDQTLAFNQGRRDGGTQQQAGKGAPRDLGVRTVGIEGCYMFTTNPGSFCNEGFWQGNTVTGVSRNPFVNKDALQPMGVTYITYYASVEGPAAVGYAFRFPAETAFGVYGSEHCGPIPTGQWECDESKWWPGDTVPRDARLGYDPQTTDGPRHTWLATPIGVKVGQTYQLRDIDCFDESVTALRDQGLHYGTLTGTECRAPSGVLG